MKDKLKGLALAFLMLWVLMQAWRHGYESADKRNRYDEGFRQGQLDCMRSALKSGNAYWVVKDGSAEFEWRYVPQWRDSCVKNN